MTSAYAERAYADIHASVYDAQHVVMVTHAKPDGDAMGSLCAMMGWLNSLGKTVTAYCADPVPREFSYLAHAQEVLSGEFTLTTSSIQPDLVIFLDISDIHRVQSPTFSEFFSSYRGKSISIDHHITHTVEADRELHDPTASSTCELVYRLFTARGYRFTEHDATALLTGVTSDTEGFANHATSPHTLAVVRSLIASGAEVNRVFTAVHRAGTLAQLKAVGRGLSRLSYNQDVDVVVSLFQAHDPELHAQEDDVLSGFTNLLKRTHSGNIILTLREYENGVIRGSMRSLDPRIDVARFAQLFPGGGGHRLAAGFSVSGKLVQENNTWKIV